MGYGKFKINGTLIKNPSAFSISRYNVTTLTRLANAKMVGDLVAVKLKFFFKYAAITSKDLNSIIDAIWASDSLFFTLTYEHNNVSKTATVYVGEFPAELHRGYGNQWVWKNVDFNLIEQ